MSFAFIASITSLFGAALIGAPIALGIFAASITYLLLSGQDMGLVAEQSLNGLFNSFVLLAVPLFIIAANIMNASAVTDRLLEFCIALVGRFRGGLAQVNVIASLIFSGMSGSAIADAAGIGHIIIRMMTKEGRYPRGFAAAVTAASSVIGPIIPPSIPMIMYALVSDTSIGYLFLGGIIPGLTMAVFLMAYNFYAARKRNFPRDEVVPLNKIPGVTVRAFPALMLPVILLSGIYGGATTPTEAAAVAAAYALILAVFFYRSLGLKALYISILEAARSTSIIGLIIAAALILNYLVASENIPNLVADKLSGWDTSPLVFMLAIMALFMLLGCLFDATTLLLIVVPLFLPTARSLGIDLVYFGVVITLNIMIGLITPPYGVLLFVINGITGIPLREIIREIWAFLFVLICALMVLVLMPDLILFLPKMFGYLPQ
ncbi:TRAP transporter large permease [Pseudovibrio sp. Tun.PSC04-5.I4]|uniref:TRAP transporter large permease n=1 Tax=Pseudovibrio sp. Tun.PSC04-5.I4 TaxID=1798213 RepID=UPI000888048D|nr:TRAP transporter large permease [Pseudovibrio sp. Tun.PSC04-5.I4]SDQ71751.1 TRAP transporter, DctM subunit [Pseudovibrio sp. Tun.PSC04-5.I4]